MKNSKIEMVYVHTDINSSGQPEKVMFVPLRLTTRELSEYETVVRLKSPIEWVIQIFNYIRNHIITFFVEKSTRTVVAGKVISDTYLISDGKKLISVPKSIIKKCDRVDVGISIETEIGEKRQRRSKEK